MRTREEMHADAEMLFEHAVHAAARACMAFTADDSRRLAGALVHAVRMMKLGVA